MIAVGFMDDAKGMADKAKDAVAGQKDTVKDGIDKAADVASDKTSGKYDEHIDTGAEKAKDVVEGLGDEA